MSPGAAAALSEAARSRAPACAKASRSQREAGTGSISAGKPGLYTNGRASVTYNDQGNPVTLEYPKPVEQVTLTSLTAKRAGDCKTDGLTIHLWKDGKDTGVKATLGKNGEHVFANLAPGHEYETKADPVADNSCTVPTVTPPSYEPKPGDKPGTSTVTDTVPS